MHMTSFSLDSSLFIFNYYQLNFICGFDVIVLEC